MLPSNALQLQIGQRRVVRIVQDVTAIPRGSEWEAEIGKVLGQSSFMIPIVTPGFLQSEWCCVRAGFRSRNNTGNRNTTVDFRLASTPPCRSRRDRGPAARGGHDEWDAGEHPLATASALAARRRTPVRAASGPIGNKNSVIFLVRNDNHCSRRSDRQP